MNRNQTRDHLNGQITSEKVLNLICNQGKAILKLQWDITVDYQYGYNFKNRPITHDLARMRSYANSQTLARVSIRTTVLKTRFVIIHQTRSLPISWVSSFPSRLRPQKLTHRRSKGLRREYSDTSFITAPRELRTTIHVSWENEMGENCGIVTNDTLRSIESEQTALFAVTSDQA